MESVIDQEFGSALKKQLADYIQKNKREDNKFHISEILMPRYAYFVRRYGKKISEEDVGFFIPGIAFHELLQKVMGPELAETQLTLGDVIGTADMVGLKFSEIKTSRKWSVPLDPDPMYVEQIGDYLAMDGTRKHGWIIVIYFVAGRKWDNSKSSNLEIVCWRVTFTDQELQEFRLNIKGTRDLLDRALVSDDFKTLKLCPPWKCGRVFKGEVEGLCFAYDKCQPEGRFPLEELIKADGKDKYQKRKADGKTTSRTSKPKSTGSYRRTSGKAPAGNPFKNRGEGTKRSGNPFSRSSR